MKLDKDSIYYAFLEIMRLYHYKMHKLLEEIGLYPGQPFVLFTLSNNDGQSQKELAERLNVKPSTITVMLKRMEKVNLVKRRQDLKDQRVSRVYITETGHEMCEKANQIMKQVEEEMFDNLTVEEKVILRRLLLVVKDNLHSSKDED